jgi:hypothetical protein
MTKFERSEVEVIKEEFPNISFGELHAFLHGIRRHQYYVANNKHLAKGNVVPINRVFVANEYKDVDKLMDARSQIKTMLDLNGITGIAAIVVNDMLATLDDRIAVILRNQGWSDDTRDK